MCRGTHALALERACYSSGKVPIGVPIGAQSGLIKPFPRPSCATPCTTQRRSSGVIWRVLLSNPWSLPGPASLVLESGITRLRTHQLNWYVSEAIPQDRRIGDLTLVMIGDNRGCTVGDSHPHPGTIMKTKAAETGILFEWALDLLRSELGSQVPYRTDLLIAGRSMQQWLDVTRTVSA